jgi:cytidylate kinase
MSKPKLDDHATRASSEQQRYKNYYSLDFYKQTGFGVVIMG